MCSPVTSVTSATLRQAVQSLSQGMCSPPNSPSPTATFERESLGMLVDSQPDLGDIRLLTQLSHTRTSMRHLAHSTTKNTTVNSASWKYGVVGEMQALLLFLDSPNKQCNMIACVRLQLVIQLLYLWCCFGRGNTATAEFQVSGKSLSEVKRGGNNAGPQRG